MCGIAGIARPQMFEKEVELFKNVLFLNQWRGTDSTGVLAIEQPTDKVRKRIRHGDGGLRTHILKAAESAAWFLENKNVDKLVNKTPTKLAFLGHTRAATIGTVSDDNAHPFELNNIIGVVNGTVPKSSIPDSSDFETDSEALLNVLDTKGVKEGAETILGLNHAPFAMVFFDKGANTLNFLRNESHNDSRPLFFAYTEDRQGIIWSSEPDFIWLAAKRQKVSLAKDGFWQPKPRVLVTLNLAEEGFIKSMKQVILVPKEAPKSVYPASAAINPGTYLASGTGAGRSGNTGVSTAKAGYPISWTAFVPDLFNKRRSKTGSGWPIGNVNGHKTEKAEKTEEAKDIFPFLGSGDTKNNIEFDATTNRLKISDPDGGVIEIEQRPESGMLSEYEERKKEITEAFDAHEAHENTEDRGRVYLGPDKNYISRDRFRQLIAGGCLHCTSIMDIDEEGIDKKIEWCKTDAGYLFVCEDCKDLNFIQDYMLRKR